MATIEQKGSIYDSELNNVDQSKWPAIKMTSTLEALNNADASYSKESFYKENSGRAEYNMDSVKAYLTKLANTANYQEFVTEVNKGNWGLMNMAVQIALEAMNYDLGTIDGLFGPKTKGQLKEFQKKYNEAHKGEAGFVPLVVDGTPGPKTVKALLEGIEPVVPTATETATETETETQTEAVTETETQTEAVTETETQTEAVTETETQTEAVTETETQTEAVTETETQTEAVTETETQTEAVTETETQTEAVTETETQTEAVTETETQTEAVTETE